ncbi:MAG: hypothetical protein KBS41_04920 [Oscillospiraceae bacterium]|nr:hypothetical protein [Candidatus Equicaccousia limihippi]
MKKSLSILLCVCLIMTTIYGCFTFTASAEEIKNYWTYGDYEDAPEGLVSCTNGSALNSYGYYFSNDAKDAIESTLSDDAYEGDYAWRMLTSNVQTGNKVGRIVSIDPGYRYEVSFMYKGGSASTNTYPFALYKADTDTVPTVSSSDYANEIQIADTDWSYIFHPAGWSWPKTDVWTNYTTSFTAGENDAYFGLIATNSAVSEIFFDNFTIRKVEDIKGYNYFEHGDADSAPDGYINATNGFGTSTTACSFRITNDNGNKVYEDHAWAEHYIWRTMDV